MTHDQSFVVSRFQNRNGTTSWRVSGFIAGVRIRKNFPTREEAAAEKSALESRAAQATSGQHTVATCLTNEQVREAEALFRRVQATKHPLAGLLDFALANYRPPGREKPLAGAVAEYLATKQLEQERTLLSLRQLRSIENELAVLLKRFPSGPVSQFTPAMLTAYFERGHPCLKTYNNRRGLIATFFKFAFRHDWVATNPVEKTAHHRINHRRGTATTLTAKQAGALMAYLEGFEGGALVPHFALCLFAGIRPCIRYGEISRLQPASVNLDTGTIHIEPEVSKVRMKRNVTIHPNLAAWLRAYPLADFPIIPTNIPNTRQKVFTKFGLTHDVLRHTFISMHVGKYRSMGEAALQAGNSESIIRKHYLDLKTPAEAEEFFGILSSACISAGILTATRRWRCGPTTPSSRRSSEMARRFIRMRGNGRSHHLARSLLIRS
ncbi:MAG: site-specific integrase [Verrucomicrobiota bacterium]